MTYHLSSLRLRSIGERSARFTDYTISTTGHSGDPQDHLVWLRNGGGKSSLLSLFYALVLPRKVDFMGRSVDRDLSDYIDGTDTAHTIAVWYPASTAGPTTLDGTPERVLVTGAVYEWSDLRRPANYRRNTDLLDKTYYAFFAAPGSFDAVNLPVTDSNGRATRRADFISQIRAMAASHPKSEFVVLEGLKDWERALADRGLDPDLFRAQKKMNHVEGGVENLFTFNTPKEFINFLIGLTVSPDTTTEIAASVGQIADKVARKPEMLADRDFCLAAAADLETLAAQYAHKEQADIAVGEAVTAALTLSRQFAAASHAAGARHEQLLLDQELLTEARRNANAERSTVNDFAFLYRERAAALRLDEAEVAYATASKALASAEGQVRVWQAVPALADHREVTAQLFDAQAQAEQEARELAPLAQAQAEHATRYRALLSVLAEDAETRATSATEKAKQARREASEHTALRKRAERDGSEAAAHAAGFRAQLERLTTHLRAAVTAGALPSIDTDPAAQHATVQTRRDRLVAERREVQGRRAARPEERRRLNALHVEAAGQQISLGHDRDALISERERHSETAAALASSPRVAVLIQASDDTPVNLWADRTTFLNAIDAEIRRAEADIVAEKVAQTDTDRILTAHTDTGYLPSTLDADRICRVLADADITASTGWAHLRTVLSVDRLPEALSNPALARIGSGVVVPTTVAEQARTVLVAAGESTVALVSVFTAEAVDSTIATTTGTTGTGNGTGNGTGTTAETHAGATGGSDLRLAPPTWASLSTGMINKDAAESEATVLTATSRDHDDRTRALQQARRDDQALRDAYTTFLDACPEGHLKTLTTQIDLLDAQRDTLAAQIREHEAALAALDADDQADTDYETRLSDEIADIEKQMSRLDLLVDAVAQRTRWEADAVAADERARDAAEDAERHEQAAEALNEQAGQHEQNATEHRRSGQDYRTTHDKVTFLTEPTLTITPEDVAGADLDTLRRRAEEAQRAYEVPASQYEAAVKVSLLTDRLKTLAESLPTDPDLKAAAERALSSPDGQSRANRASALEEAERTRRYAAEVDGRAKAQVETARKDLTDHQQRRPDVVRRATPVEPANAAHATALAEENEAESARLRDVITRVENDLTANEKARADLDQRRNLLRVFDNDLRNNGIIDPNEPPLEVHQPEEDDTKAHRAPAGEVASEVGMLAHPAWFADVDPFDGDNDTAEREKDFRLAQVKSARTRAEHVEKTISDLVSALRLTSEKYKNVPAKARDRLANDAPMVLAANAAHLATNLFLRAEQRESDLYSISEDQSIVAATLANAVADNFDTLRRTSRFSDLPDGLGGLSGKRLLKINFTAAADEELQSHVNAVIEETIAKGNKPDGLDLLKAATHAAVGSRGFTVKVLKPVHDLTPVEESIDALGRWSGGERLTAGVALYCTIAKVRAVNSGNKDRYGGMLILDNPIGRASHGPLIDLQRKVAAAQGVQLLYATGVKDFDAVSHFPGITRLENSIGRAGNRRYIVDMDDHVADAIFGTRIVHAERPDRPAAAGTA